MYHKFFIYLSVDGHLGCYHVLAIVNSVAVNTGVHVSFLILFFHVILFFFEGLLLYRILLFSVKPQHESNIDRHTSPPF